MCSTIYIYIYIYIYTYIYIYIISDCSKYPGGKFGHGESKRKLVSKSSILSLTGASGCWLLTDYTSHRKVVNESSVNARSPVITLNAHLINLTKNSQALPIHRD